MRSEVTFSPMPMNEESRNHLALFVANVAMLQHAISRDATREQVLARISLLDADMLALAERLAHEDPELGEALKRAWQEPARVVAGNTSRKT
jgi:sigma54-dependent transcription regulator